MTIGRRKKWSRVAGEKKEEEGDTRETNGKWGKVDMETPMGGGELQREGEMKTMCSYIKCVSTSHCEIEKDGRKERRAVE